MIGETHTTPEVIAQQDASSLPVVAEVPVSESLSPGILTHPTRATEQDALLAPESPDFSLLHEAQRRLERSVAARRALQAELEREQAHAARRAGQTRELRRLLEAESSRAAQEQRKARAVARVNAGLQVEVEKLRAKCKRVVAEREDLSTELAHLEAAAGSQLLSNPMALSWLTKSRAKTVLRLSQEVVVVGQGPLPADDMGRVLKRAGFKVRQTGTETAAVMVVGRDDWLIDDLEEQIQARKARGLKVFSQEMLIAALATRDDPFETADRKTLLSFAERHGALEYLIEAGFEWPFLTWRPLEVAEELDGRGFVEESPVHRLGYVAGKTAGLPDKVRRRALSTAFTAKLPRVHSTEYMATWGTPGGRIRLRRMARHLARFARLWQTEPNYDVAVRHWETDLDWLHEEYYEPWMRFRWPEMAV